jgi:hypothetical protein
MLGQEQNHMTDDSNDVSIRKIQDPLSCVSLRISMCFNDKELATGTAFIYLYEEKPYLITNWHNVSGREPSTLKAKHPDCACPNRLFVEVPFIHHETSSIIWKKHQVPIYQDDGDSPSKSIWYEHPLHRYKVDVVAIPVHEDEVFSPLKSYWYGIQSAQKRPEPIESSIENIICPATAPCLNLSLVRFNPGQGVFVLGFPEGMTGGANFPVWKRGSIASEPYLDIDDLPKIFIDTATRAGMSGAPVYVHETGRWETEVGGGLKRSNGSSFGIQGRRFIGVYSGRVGDDTFKAQLGVVWKYSVIKEIIKSSTLGKSSFDLSPL